ncbi:metallopeptidase family protein [Candidatus Parcubacteria bacterium]|nr:MAG: metallopeptidase family protein [Candidatus Parcubacteria bacterium]
MNKDQFEELVKDGVAEIPERFLCLIDNVGIVIEKRPTIEQRKKFRLRGGMSLFGLYEGIPRTRRDNGYNGVLPDKITIFMEPILEAARDEEDAKELVRDTVWHEIAHHFGLSERGVREAEKKRLKKRK